MTAAATRGPARAPRPTSSTPAMTLKPHRKKSRSYDNISFEERATGVRMEPIAFPRLRERWIARTVESAATLPTACARIRTEMLFVAHTLVEIAPPLRDARGPSGETPQVIELRPAYPAIAGDFDPVDTRRMEQERSFDADAVRGHAADGEVLVDATSPAADHDPLEYLDALARPFHDLGVHPHGIAGPEFRNVLKLLLLNGADQLRYHAGPVLVIIEADLGHLTDTIVLIMRQHQ